MFGIGANELVLIILFGFILFGPDKLPAMAKTLGRAIARFRAARSEMDKLIREEILDPENGLGSVIDAFDDSAKKGSDKKDELNTKDSTAKPRVSADRLYGLPNNDKKGE